MSATRVNAQQHFEHNGRNVTYNGNAFLMSEPVKQVHVVTDPIDGKQAKVNRNIPLPLEMNGKKIYNTSQVTTASTCKTSGGSLERYLMDGLSHTMKAAKWPDGTYRIDVRSVIVDENGKVVYYTYEGIKLVDKDNMARSINDGPMAVDIEKLMTKAPMHPAMYQGKPVVAYYSMNLDDNDIVVKDHAVFSYTKNKERVALNKQ